MSLVEMLTDTADQERARTAECPDCHAQPGQRCRVDGLAMLPRHVHTSRVDAAAAHRAADPPP